MNIGELIKNFFSSMGFMNGGAFDNTFPLRLIMILIGCLLIYLAIAKDFEPYLLIPIGVGILLVNLAPALMQAGTTVPGADGSLQYQPGGLLYELHKGISLELFPPLIFLGIGATTDFGPLISNPKSLLLGAAAQFGIFATFLGAILLGFDALAASSIGIIGGADGPTAILLSNKLLGNVAETTVKLFGGEFKIDGPTMCAMIAVVAYSYMALVPIIQPPIIKLLTTKKERTIHMEETRQVSQREKILFPIVVMIVVILLIPDSAALIGMLMLGNLIKESGCVPNLVDAAAKTLMYAVTILLGLSVGATAILTSYDQAIIFLLIFVLGLIAFSFATAGGVLIGKLMCWLTHGKINPMIGAAGVSAVPMAARVVHKLGLEEDDSNYLLMHAMGPNVAGVIGSAVAAGLLLTIFG